MSAEVDNILRSFWEWRLKESPEFATQIGVHTYDKNLDDHSLGAYAKRQDDCRDFIKKLKAVAKSELSKNDALNVKLLQSEIEMYLDGSKHKSYLFPLINLEGPQLEFARLVSWMKFETHEDYEKYFSRLEAFPTQASELIALLEEGVRTHYVPPHLTVSHVPEQIKKVLSAEITGDNHIFTPLKKFPEAFSEEDRASFKERGIKLIEEKVKPAFQKIHDYYFDKYLRQTRDSISCTNFPNGTEFYKQALKFHIACDMTAQEVHDLGQNEVKRIRSRMNTIIKEVGFEGGIKEFLEMLRTEERFYYDTKEELLNGYKVLCEKIIKPKLGDYFKEMPKTPFEIIETPADSAPVAPAAFYMGPSEDGSRPGVFMVNTYKHNTRPKYEMVSLALHEAVPGHHLQTAFAMEQEEQPSFRRHVEDRRYYEVPARFALNTAYMEGWGLYCEYLGEEMGLYEDPYDLFGRLSTEILRACRLVVDTGMHAFGWSRQQAVDFMVENTAVSLHNVNTEVDRYIIWPGQACAYKVGEIKIKELRRKAEQKLGDKFGIKDYHHVFLSAGPMGLDTLEEAVDEYINSTLARSIFTHNSMSAEVENILSSFWEWRLKESPEFATQIGVHTYDKSLDDHGLGAYAKRQDDCRDFIKKLKAVAKSKLSKNDALNVKLLQKEIETYLDGSKHESYLFPLINLEGPQVKFSRLVSWMKFETKEDYEKYFSRLEAFPTQASELIALLQEGVRTHYVPPRLAVSHVPEQIKKVLDADITGDNHLFTPLKKFPEMFSEEERASFKERGIKLIEEKVKPAFKKIHDYYLEKYLCQTRDSISCTNLPNGTEFYKQALKFHIACDMTAQEVHDLGQNEVKRIRSRMDNIIKEVGFEGSFKEFLEMLRTEKRFYYDTKEELLNGYKGLCEKIIKSKLKNYLKEIPKTPFEIIEIPADLAPVASAAFYMRPSEGGARPGVFMVNTYKHNTRPKFEMVAIALHEAVPGHHLQTAFAMEQEEQPSFRRHVDDRRYYEVPARFPINTAYMEGWGLYCEYLGEEMGLYKDPYDLFGRLSIEILRACRLVVDTGMHAFGWSRRQAVDFMVDNTAASLHNVNTEVDRYITWPGQACSYKVGEIKIRELRRKAEQKLGDKFDIKDYHHVFLSAGPMGLDTLEEAVDEYIDITLAQ